MASSSSENELGFSGSLSYSKSIRWLVGQTNGNSQNVITYMSSMYNCSGNISRRFGQFGLERGCWRCQDWIDDEVRTCERQREF